jgi:hypothetical protein
VDDERDDGDEDEKGDPGDRGVLEQGAAKVFLATRGLRLVADV